MNGNNFMVDTNIALYLLSGNGDVAEILNGAKLYVSFVTQLELLGYPGITIKEQSVIRNFLDDCIIVDITDEIKNLTISIRRKHQIKLPDSIIAATALFMDLPLITADKGFTKISSLNLLLYEE